MVSLSVIVPTVGRLSLGRTLDSIAHQLEADEVIVVADSDFDAFRAASIYFDYDDSRWQFAECGGDEHGKGYAQRELGITLAHGTHLLFMDDDDVYEEGALDLFRNAACDRPVIFRMAHPQHGLLWRYQELVFGNVGTPMFMVPNEPEKLGRWAPYRKGLNEPGGDFSFIAGCVAGMGAPVWRHEVVASIRPALVSV